MTVLLSILPPFFDVRETCAGNHAACRCQSPLVIPPDKNQVNIKVVKDV